MQKTGAYISGNSRFQRSVMPSWRMREDEELQVLETKMFLDDRTLSLHPVHKLYENVSVCPKRQRIARLEG